MKTLGNILWHFPFFGFVSAISVWLFGLLLTITVVAAPIGMGLMELGKFLFWPFGNAMVSKSDLKVDQNAAWKTYSTIVMVIYFPFGLFFAVVAVFQIAGLFVSIIGIPAALVVAKCLSTYLNPVNKVCVSSSVKEELERRQASSEIERHLGGSDKTSQNSSQPTNTGAPPVTETTAEPAIAQTPPVHQSPLTSESKPSEAGTKSDGFCTNCGTKYLAEDNFCMNCGAKLR